MAKKYTNFTFAAVVRVLLCLLWGKNQYVSTDREFIPEILRILNLLEKLLNLFKQTKH